jgi:hypothetical protein
LSAPLIPNRERAVIDPAKLRDYLLSRFHPVGRFKSVFLHRLGYTSEQWEILDRDLRHVLLEGTPVAAGATPYGRKYQVRGRLTTPSGTVAEFVTIWILLRGEDFPRFVTAYPGEGP